MRPNSLARPTKEQNNHSIKLNKGVRGCEQGDPRQIMGWFGSTPSFASLNDVNRMKAEGDVKSLLKILRDYNQVSESFDDHRHPIAVAAADAMKEIGKPAVELLIEALDVTVIRAEFNGHIFNKSDGSGYLDPMNSVGYYRAVMALGNIGDERAVAILYNILCINDEELGSATAEALSSIGGKLAVDALIAVLNDKIFDWAIMEDDMKDFAAVALGVISEEKRCDQGYLENAIKPLFKASKHSNKYVRKSAIEALEKIPQSRIIKAKRHERLLEFDEAAEIYKGLEMEDEIIRVRKLKAEQGSVKVDQTVVHGDYIDDRDTIVKDSVINRSNVGAGGKTKAEEIKEIKELLDSGAIDDDEFKQMKKEILGK